MSVKSLAQKVEVSSNHLYRLEAGRRKPSPELYGKLIRTLGLRLGDLLGNDEEARSAAEDAA